MKVNECTQINYSEILKVTVIFKLFILKKRV